VLLDLLLPKMNGFDYLKAMKSNAKLKNIPVVVLSNLGNDEDVDRAKKLGAEDYFIKSDTDLSVLAEKVEKSLNK
jgi:PleD family two-component response regulator